MNEQNDRPFEAVPELGELHEKAAGSRYRGKYHIQPVTGLLNDPNGFVRYKGLWHLFYQWYPWGAVHGLKHWYHMVSEDLAEWRQSGVFLIPEKEYVYDNDGAFSGTAVPYDGGLGIFYTGNNRDDEGKAHPYTCFATMGENGRAVKAEKPLFGPHPSYTHDQRDPKIVVRDGRNYLILGARRRSDKTGHIIIYSSDKITEGWSFQGELSVPGFEDFGGMWECPSIEHLDGKDLLMFCPQMIELSGRGPSRNHCGYIIGKMDWDSLTFTPESGFNLFDHGFDFYAPQCAGMDGGSLRNGALPFIGWMGLPAADYPTDREDWSGSLSLMREISIRDGKLIQKPLEGLKVLREEKEPEDLSLDRLNPIEPTAEYEIELSGGEFSISFFTDKDGLGGITLSFDPKEQKITLDRSGMKQKYNLHEGFIRKAKTKAAPKSMRVFIDSSTLEIFINEGEMVFSSRVFPTDEEKYLRSIGAVSGRVWRLGRAVQDEAVF